MFPTVQKITLTGFSKLDQEVIKTKLNELFKENNIAFESESSPIECINKFYNALIKEEPPIKTKECIDMILDDTNYLNLFVEIGLAINSAYFTSNSDYIIENSSLCNLFSDHLYGETFEVRESETDYFPFTLFFIGLFGVDPQKEVLTYFYENISLTDHMDNEDLKNFLDNYEYNINPENIQEVKAKYNFNFLYEYNSDC